MRQTIKILRYVGNLALLIQLGLILTLVIFHQLAWINAWLFPLKSVSAFLIFGGFTCKGLAWSLERKHRSQGLIHHKGTSSVVFKLTYGLALFLLLLNGLAYVAAYHMTHVRESGALGLGIPKPLNQSTPADRNLPYQTLRIPISPSEWLEAWAIPAQGPVSQGTILLFPGNLGTKSKQLLAPAQSFSDLGYASLLIDFQGVGGSTGSTTTIGMREASDVAAAVQFQQKQHPGEPMILYGVSMGSSAILRAIAELDVQPTAIILELPFARLTQALKSRLRSHHIPGFPTAELLLFWGWMQHGYNGFSHNPVEFAQAVTCPALVIHGAQDPWTRVQEVEDIFQHIKGPKELIISKQAGHHQLIGVNRPLWDQAINTFLEQL